MRNPVQLVSAVIVAASLGTAASAQESIKIGFHAPLTGFAAADGKSARQGAELAVKEANAAGGIGGKKITLVTYDDEGKPENAIPIANKLIGQDKVVMSISGSYSGPTRAAAAVFQRAGMPYISAYAIHPDITRAGDFVFRTGMMGEVQGRAGAKLIGETLKKKKVEIVAVNNDFGQALTAGFKEAAPKFGLEIVAERTFGMPIDKLGINGKICDTLNDIISLNEILVEELTVARNTIGTQGRLNHRVELPKYARGSWNAGADSINSLISDLVYPTIEIAHVISSVAKGNLSQEMPLKIGDHILQGEFAKIAKEVNDMCF